jgi:alpha-glucuronidase
VRKSAAAPGPAAAREDGSELWLRYRPVADAGRLAEYRAAAREVVIAGDSPTLRAAGDELRLALAALLGAAPPIARAVGRDGALVVGTPAGSPTVAALAPAAELARVGPEGFVLRAGTVAGRRVTVVAGATDVGALRGTFALLARMQEQAPVAALDTSASPRVALRLLNHWDNLDRSVERGYAGRSLWAWDSLPDRLSAATRARLP